MSASPRGVLLEDFNGDSYIDLLAASSSAGIICIWLGAGNGTFGLRSDFSCGATPNAVVPGDFNSDGNLM